jgi:FKBP-type peptidyl-prolyl cis-trans isomerase
MKGLTMSTRSRRVGFVVFALAALVVFAGAPSFAQNSSAQPPTAAAAPPPAPADVAKVPADAQKSASGLAWKVLKPGTGTTRPSATDRVTVNYNGWTADGRIFDSTDMRGKPSTFIVGNILPGMSEALQLMTVGEKRRYWIPEKLAFKGAPGKPAGTCVFEIELLDVQAGGPQTIPAPPDVEKPPADAQKTKSGLASRVLQPGTGTAHPTSSSTVTVNYTGWTTDGKMFDSSVVRGTPATFQLNQVISGWTEGVQLMVEGEKRRFWIPGNLAYDNVNRPGVPKGMLVFDVELLKVQ